MPWNPSKAIITARAIPENLLTWLIDADRQEAALTWADGPGLKLVKTFQNSLAEPDKPVYPAIAYSDDNGATDYKEDLLGGAYSVTFQVSIQNRDADEAVIQARKYAEAFESLIVNCPEATLLAGTGATDIILDSIEQGFERIKAHVERKNDFLQQFQIRVTYVLRALAVS